MKRFSRPFSQLVLTFAVAAMLPSSLLAAEAERNRFGSLPNGREVAKVTLSNGSGLRATIIAYGGCLQSLIVPDRNGNKVDVDPVPDLYPPRTRYLALHRPWLTPADEANSAGVVNPRDV